IRQYRREIPASCLQNTEKQVPRTDLMVAQFTGLFLSQHDRDPGITRELLERHWSSPPVVLLVHRLPTHAQRIGDGLPTPALLAGIGDVDGLQPLLQTLQGPHRAQTLSR